MSDNTLSRFRVLLTEGEGDEYHAFESYFWADDIKHAAGRMGRLSRSPRRDHRGWSTVMGRRMRRAYDLALIVLVVVGVWLYHI